MVKKENSQNIEEIIKKAVRAEIQNIFEGSIKKRNLQQFHEINQRMM